MTPSSKNRISPNINCGKIKGKEVVANFSGGRITSDAGIILMAELDKKLKITAKESSMFSRQSSLFLCGLFCS